MKPKTCSSKSRHEKPARLLFPFREIEINPKSCLKKNAQFIIDFGKFVFGLEKKHNKPKLLKKSLAMAKEETIKTGIEPVRRDYT